MSFFHRSLWVLGLLLIAATATAQVIVEQVGAGGRRAGIRPDGFVLEAGLAAPVHGDNAPLIGLSVGMGTLFSRHLDLSVDVRRWSTDLDRSDFGNAVDGSFSDLSMGLSLRLPMMKISGLRPYVGAGVAGHLVGADVPGDRSLEDALSGFNTGVHASFGLATTAPGVGMRLQARRDYVDDVGAWTLSAGFGWWPKQRAAPSASRRSSAGTRVTTVTSPAVEMYAPVDGEPTIRELTLALNHLKAENRRLEADLASLRNDVAQLAAVRDAAPAATPTATPAPAQPAVQAEALPVARVEERPDRTAELFDALERVAARSGNPGALSRNGDTGLLTLDQTLLFKTGEWELMVQAREELLHIAMVLLRFPEARIVVQGHTDSSGRAAWNQTLSERRARAVGDELLRLGVSPDRLATMGFGPSRPIDSNDSIAGRARNRRVDLLVTLDASR